ncbi:Fc receptor-like protein 5 [Leuresthes tenuis]|uniref:Fc receptor-like protein 5 n=1 Tax=Leuresthes tenuis TaxID=355514 RepID=UPI003B513D20
MVTVSTQNEPINTYLIHCSWPVCFSLSIDPELSLEHDSFRLFAGESVTLKCDIRNGSVTDWLYEFNRNGRQIAPITANKSFSMNLTADLGGDYQCIAHRKGLESFTKESNNLTLSVSADTATIPEGGRVNLTCSVEDSASWKYDWFIRAPDANKAANRTNAAQNFISISEEGIYWCRGRRGNPAFFTGHSEIFYIEKKLSGHVTVKLQHNWTQVFSGEMISIRCEIQGGRNNEWEYEWRTTSSNAPPTQEEHSITASVSDSGDYWCKGRRGLYSSTDWSNALTLKVSYKPRPRAMADRRVITVGGNANLTCSMENSAEWEFFWFRHTSNFSEIQVNGDGKPDRVISISQGGLYFCRGGRGEPVNFTDDSDVVAIENRVSSRAAVSLHPNWPLIFAGETITVTCGIYSGGNADWVYGWSKPNSDTVPTNNGFTIINASASSSGNYSCMGRHKQDLFSTTEWSDVITLTVLERRPKAHLSASRGVVPVGGSVTLICSVRLSSSGWKYYWYRGRKISGAEEIESSSAGEISVSERGLYWCRGGRGDRLYYTEYSDSISIDRIDTNRPVVTRQPNWPVIYYGETISLRCEIHGGNTAWAYEWMTTRSSKLSTQSEVSVTVRYSSDSYWCKGRMKSALQHATEWSFAFKLPECDRRTHPVLTVSPSWLSPGASVTLSCEVEHPSAGWRFYWYKAAPDLHSYLYTYEPLPGSMRETEESSYIIHGQAETAGYGCIAGRGDPVYYSDYSEAQFVWSGDFHPSTAVTVIPGRVQHFTSESVSLKSDGNFSEWSWMNSPRQRNYNEDFFNLWNMYSSIYDIYSHSPYNGVYWCVSGSGEFSNAVNITIHDGHILLVSPVHPVNEGSSVTLSCKLRRGNFTATVAFYKNDKVIQNGDKEELTITAVSKSDEGFYKCEHSGEVSPQSWMSVKYELNASTSSLPVSLLVGLVIGGLLAVILTMSLICWCTKSNESH